MAGGCIRCLSPLVAHISLLVFVLCTSDAEVSSCPHQGVLYKNVGEDVELSCFQGGDVFDITWKYNGATVADSDGLRPSSRGLFQDRLSLNLTTFSLIVENLKLTDSGQFSFVVFVAGDPPKQLPTVFFSLQVVEVLTAAVTSTSTWNALNASCTVVLECSSGASGRLWYRWSVRNRTTTGPRLTYIIGEEDGDTVFTCTVNNSVSEVSASKVLTCSNRTEKDKKTAEETEETSFARVVLLVRVILFCVITVAGLATLVHYRRRRQEAKKEPVQEEPEHQGSSTSSS